MRQDFRANLSSEQDHPLSPLPESGGGCRRQGEVSGRCSYLEIAEYSNKTFILIYSLCQPGLPL
jgi:hypothetical protein